MQWFLIGLFIVVVVAVVMMSTTMGKSASSGTVDPFTEIEKGPHVRYRVPPGQDPVVVISTLREAGFNAVPDQASHEQAVVVGLKEDTAETRETVRQVIAGAQATNVEGPPVIDPRPVRFEGESDDR